MPADATLQNSTDPRDHVRRLMKDFSLEITPGSAAKIDRFSDHVRAGTRIYVTFLPGSSLKDTVAVSTRIRAEGFEPIPHIAARSLGSRGMLDESLRQLRGEADIQSVLLIAGSVSTPLGDFSDTMQVLASGLLDKHGVRNVGLAGHPEGSPDISDERIHQALKWKNDFASQTDANLYLVTQFCFQAEPIIAWDRKLRQEGNRLPIHVGVPGLATIKTLISHARACGIGTSMTFLTRQAMNVAKLLTVSTPDHLISTLATYQAQDASCGIVGVHMYPLGGLKRTADWSYAVADGRFDWDRTGQGFEVTET